MLQFYLLVTIACIISTFIYLSYKHYTNFFFLIVIQILIYGIINSLKYRITRNLRNESQAGENQVGDEENAFNSGNNSSPQTGNNSQNLDATLTGFEPTAPLEDDPPPAPTVGRLGWNFKPPSYEEPPSFEEFSNLKKK